MIPLIGRKVNGDQMFEGDTQTKNGNCCCEEGRENQVLQRNLKKEEGIRDKYGEKILSIGITVYTV
ncbi:Hypothetical predicted protein, partial [Marmota monax]